MSTDDTIDRRELWKRYSAIIATISIAYVLLIGVVFLVAPELVVPIGIGGGLVIAFLGNILARRTRRRDPLTER
jgi:hypothetical protein